MIKRLVATNILSWSGAVTIKLSLRYSFKYIQPLVEMEGIEPTMPEGDWFTAS